MKEKIVVIVIITLITIFSLVACDSEENLNTNEKSNYSYEEVVPQQDSKNAEDEYESISEQEPVSALYCFDYKEDDITILTDTSFTNNIVERYFYYFPGEGVVSTSPDENIQLLKMDDMLVIKKDGILVNLVDHYYNFESPYAWFDRAEYLYQWSDDSQYLFVTDSIQGMIIRLSDMSYISIDKCAFFTWIGEKGVIFHDGYGIELGYDGGIENSVVVAKHISVYEDGEIIEEIDNENYIFYTQHNEPIVDGTTISLSVGRIKSDDLYKAIKTHQDNMLKFIEDNELNKDMLWHADNMSYYVDYIGEAVVSVADSLAVTIDKVSCYSYTGNTLEIEVRTVDEPDMPLDVCIPTGDGWSYTYSEHILRMCFLDRGTLTIQFLENGISEEEARILVDSKAAEFGLTKYSIGYYVWALETYENYDTNVLWLGCIDGIYFMAHREIKNNQDVYLIIPAENAIFSKLCE